MPHHAHKARLLGRTAPNDLVDIWHGQQSTDPFDARLSKQAGLQLLTTSAGATPEASLQYIGLSPPVQGVNSRQAPGNALARVNVPNRYLGNKACKYETNDFAPLRANLRAESTKQGC